MADLEFKDGRLHLEAIDVGGATVEAADNPEYVDVMTDNEGKVIEGIRTDGTKVIGGDLEVGGELKLKDVPQQIKDYVEGLDIGGSGVSNIEYDEETGDLYATYNDESGVTDVYMDDNGDIYVEIEDIIINE